MTQREIAELPKSVLVYPDSLFDRIKYYGWRFYSPYHEWWRDMLVRFRVLSHSGRQQYLFGTVSEGKQVRDFINHLISNGYAHHHIAWRDDDELVSLRLLDGFTHQYHVRVFCDGEVRAHYEYTPEYRPFLHYKAIGQEERRDYFRELFRDWLV